jgi:hypothetical protein
MVTCCAGRLGMLLFKHVVRKVNLGHPLFPDYYFQLAASTWYDGSGDRVMARFIQYRFAQVCECAYVCVLCMCAVFVCCLLCMCAVYV